MKFVAVANYAKSLILDYTDPKYGDPMLSVAYRLPIIWKSAPGIGKTSLYRYLMEWARWYLHPTPEEISAGGEELERRLQVQEYLTPWAGANGQVWDTKLIELASVDVPDVRGYLAMTKYTKPDGGQGYLSEYSYPAIFPSPLMSLIGLIFLDEYGQLEADMQKPAAPVMLEGRIGDYQTRWLRWGASNRMKDASGVKKELAHSNNRTKEINIEPQAEELVAVLSARGFPALALGFIAFRPGVVFNDELSDATKREGAKFCSPRSFENGLLDLQLLSGGPGSPLRLDEEAQEHVAGWIGKPAAAEFFKYMELTHKVPKLEEIVDNPTEVRVPQEISLRFALMGIIIDGCNEKNVGPLLTFIGRLPKELQVTIVHALSKRLKSVVASSPEFAKWTSRNADIILAVHALAKGE